VILGVVLFREPISAARLGFLGMLVVSILGLKLTAHPETPADVSPIAR